MSATFMRKPIVWLCLSLMFSFSAHANLAVGNAATPAANVTVPAGFKAELVRSALTVEGSWVCLAIDDKGRLIISPQDILRRDASGKVAEGGLLRMTLGADGNVALVERIDLPVGGAMGLLYAFNSLYVSGEGAEGTGLYRLTDTNGDDKYDKVEFLKQFEGTFRTPATGEHGPHGIVLGPDNHLYIINGNETKAPSPLRPDSPHKNYAEDQLLPQLLWPANYTWANGYPPAGYVVRTDKDGKEWTLIAGGLRNSYDLAFNRDGEMFTFDSDMDWDDGAPWYRPTRVNHIVSGGEYGWRKGSGKWPDYYPDSLRSTLDIGRSSPTGVKFGYDAQFPRPYRMALFLCDWAFGTIYAVQLTPSGASYKAKAEPFVTGRPLNVTDMEFGKDGAMYFITGGRGTQSGLYRVTYMEPLPKVLPKWGPPEQEGSKQRALRHELEAFHGKVDPKAIDFLWPHLDSGDRTIRYAARIALEWQDVNLWKARALSEANPNAGLAALLALARCAGKETQVDLLKGLAKWPLDTLSEEQKLDKLRVIEVSFSRQGKPEEALRKLALEKLGKQYPSSLSMYNRELCNLLVFLEAPDVVEKTMKLLQSSTVQEDQIHYAFTLRFVKQGWTPELRRAYFAWFPKAAEDYHGSSKVLGFLEDIRKDAMTSLNDTERTSLASLLATPLVAASVPTNIPARAFVKEWTMKELVPQLDQVSKGRSFEKGKNAFLGAQCVLCHRFGSIGGAVGPDITAAGNRYTRTDLLEAIMDPSKVVPDMFQNVVITTRNGEEHTGRILTDEATKVVLQPNPLQPAKIEILKSNITKQDRSKLSPMPEGLLNVLSREEILDLIAYLESGGSPNYPSFQK
jgi:putative heme-binding domain-containing protein